MDKKIEKEKKGVKWLIKSAEERELSIIIGIEPGAKLTPELEKSLDNLSQTLQREEVQDILRAGCTLINCKPFSCPDLTMCAPISPAPPRPRPCTITA